MGDLDTDPQMMRRQQAQDMSETIPADETAGPKTPTDTDPESLAAREAAKADEITRANTQQDAVFEQNKRGEGAAETDQMASAATDGVSLAHPGRSLLGS